MYDKIGFFKIKSPEQRADPLDGCIRETTHSLAVLNIAPASFGHIIIFPKNQHANDLCDQDGTGYMLSSSELEDFFQAEQQAQETITRYINHDPSPILAVYTKRLADEDLMNKTGQGPRIKEMIYNYNENKKRNIMYTGIGNSFENRGPHSGRMISTYHTQFVPQRGLSQTFETYQALGYLLHEQKFPSHALSYDDIMTTSTGIIYETDQYKARWEAFPVSFGHASIIHKNPSKTLLNSTGEEIIAYYEFVTTTQKIITDTINNHPDILRNRYQSHTTAENKQQIQITQNYVKHQKDPNGRIIQPDMTDQQFYHGGGSFFPLITDSRIHHFVPRYAFDRAKQGTGTALYNNILTLTRE